MSAGASRIAAPVETTPLAARLTIDLARTRGTGVADVPAPDAVEPLLARALGVPLARIATRPGKGLRARMMHHAFAIAAAGGQELARAIDRRASPVLPPELPLAIEALHAGSLVVDDIQDDAVERRGAPALHLIHGVPIALNAGNWLYFWSTSLLGRAGLPPAIEVAARRALEDAVLLCHAGQALDLSVRVTTLTRGAVREVVATGTRWKTGALVALSTTLGALAARGPTSTTQALARFGEEVGVAFQMADDLSSIVASSRRAKAEEDLLGERPTWPWAWAAEVLDDVGFGALQRVAREAAEERAPIDDVIGRMRPLVEHRGRVCVRHALERAFERLRAELPVRSVPRVETLEAEVRTAVEALHGA